MYWSCTIVYKLLRSKWFNYPITLTFNQIQYLITHVLILKIVIFYGRNNINIKIYIQNTEGLQNAKN